MTYADPQDATWTPSEPTPTAKPSHRWLWITITAVGLVLVGAISFLGYTNSQAHSDVTKLQHQVSTLKTQAQSLSSQQGTLSSQQSKDEGTQKTDEGSISSVQNSVTALGNQMGQLSRPNNPLASYNEVCTINNTNSQTGVVQTYYYPCTNAATPAPGA